MEKRLYNIFWATNARNFMDSILESFYKVLSSEVNIATF